MGGKPISLDEAKLREYFDTHKVSVGGLITNYGFLSQTVNEQLNEGKRGFYIAIGTRG